MIYLVYGTAWEETIWEKAFVRKDMAELEAVRLNAESDDRYWYSVSPIELVE